MADLPLLAADLAEFYPPDPAGASGVPRLTLAGNVTDVQAQVINSAAQGMLAAAAVNAH